MDRQYLDESLLKPMGVLIKSMIGKYGWNVADHWTL
jgi:hypothetical protein